MTKIVALTTGDWHMSDQPPACRAETKKEWYEVQGGYLDQLSALQKKHGDVPILHAGDVFDRWDSPAELVNFLIDRMPHVYAVAGNHDLPNHSLMDIKRSSYWTLVQAGRISDLNVGRYGPIVTRGLALHGFPHGLPTDKRKPIVNGKLNISVVHRYVWSDTSGRHPNARGEDHILKFFGDYGGMVIHTGDHHAPFVHHFNQRSVVNCGIFIRRKSDEAKYEPFVGVVHDSCSVEMFPLDTSKDRFREVDKKVEEVGLDATEVVEELNRMADTPANFEDTLRHYLKAHRVVGAVAEATLKALEEAKG